MISKDKYKQDEYFICSPNLFVTDSMLSQINFSEFTSKRLMN